jgi:hypothetical protein
MSATPLAVAVLGPTHLARVGAAAGIPPAHYEATAASVGRLLAEAGHALIVVPDRGVAMAAMDAYLDAGGPRCVGLCPSSGVSEPAAPLAIASHRARCHEIVDDCSWYEQHHRIGVMSDRMVCIGVSCGTIAELAWTKWTPGPPVALIAGTTSPLPPEILAETPIEVLELDRLAGWFTPAAVASS